MFASRNLLLALKRAKEQKEKCVEREREAGVVWYQLLAAPRLPSMPWL
jgi:hypothetical protein